jgi:acyl-ACP thioesterase
VYADWEDLDMNGHVNNVNAIGWCLAQHDFAFLTRYRPEFLEANFLAEMFCGEKFMVLLEESPPGGAAKANGARTVDYLVVREPDQVSTLRLRIRYREAQKSG